MAARKRMRLTDAAIARLRPREREYTVWDSRVPGLGVRVRPTGARTFVMLRDVGGESRRVSLGPVSTMGNRRGPQGMPRAAGRPRARQRDRAETRCSAVAGVHRGRVEGGPLRPVQAIDEKERPLPALRPHPARIRIEKARPYDRCTALALVRRLQPHSSRQRQSCPGAASADHELRGRLRLHREEPDPGYQAQPPAQAYPLFVARGDPPPAPGPRCTDRKEQSAAGRHHSPSAAHRMPQG